MQANATFSFSGFSGLIYYENIEQEHCIDSDINAIIKELEAEGFSKLVYKGCKPHVAAQTDSNTNGEVSKD